MVGANEFLRITQLTNDELKNIIDGNKKYTQGNSRNTRKQLIEKVRFIQKTLQQEYNNSLRNGCLQHGTYCDCGCEEEYLICAGCKNFASGNYCRCEDDEPDEWSHICSDAEKAGLEVCFECDYVDLYDDDGNYVGCDCNKKEEK